MKSGYLIKSASFGEPKNNELNLINNYTRRPLKKEEIYVFSVVLCDNEVDREYECFTKDSLDKLSELFIGKTGICDHEMKSENQTARIFDCNVELVEGKTTSYGEQYYRLVAKAYMPMSDKNKDFILELDSGIRKEVSVSCSVDKVTCSICGFNQKVNPCRHVKGRKYGDQNFLCFTKLEEPKDAYEWSFVAVPAQRNAGVIKGFNPCMRGGVFKMEDIMKSLAIGEEITLHDDQVRKLYNFISELKEKAQDGEIYRKDLKKEVVRLCSIAQPDIESEIMGTVADKMTLEELKSFKKSFEAGASNIIPQKPQLMSNKNLSEKVKGESKNTQFKI